MVTARALLSADPDQFREVAGYYRRAAASLADRGGELDAARRALGTEWSGAAQRSALAALAGVRARLIDATVALTAADQVLSEFAESIAMARRRVGDESLGTVGRSLRMAEAADADAARRLNGTAGWFQPTTVTPQMPSPGSAPAVVAQWWQGLGDAERRAAITSGSARLIGLDGVPADARDEAARLQLAEQEADLRYQRDRLAANGLSTAEASYQIGGLDRLRGRLDDPDARARAYLLDLDATDNRAVWSIGDPDRASDVVTIVPGVGSGLDNAGPALNDGTNLWNAATNSAQPGADVAAVSWLDYSAPETLVDAARSAPAQDAADPLARFAEGLAATHAGPPAHETLLGYSYGSTVVGASAAGHHLPVDDIVLVASPGVGAEHASDLGLDPDHVWATTAPSDAVRLAKDPAATLTDVLAGRPPSHLWFGTDPTSAEFGANVFDSPHGSWLHPVQTHLSYFDDGSRSVANLGAIVDGESPDGRS